MGPVAMIFNLLSAEEAAGLRVPRYFLYLIIGISAIAPILIGAAAALRFAGSRSRVPIFSDLLAQYPAITIGTAVFFLGLIVLVTRYRVFARFLVPPIVVVEVDKDGIVLRDSRGGERSVSWDGSNLRLELDAYSAGMALPNAAGYHWGRVLFVSGYTGGWCQVDDEVLEAIFASASDRGVGIRRSLRRTLEGPAERLSFRPPQRESG
ncbi:MAG: hypothetical protein L3J96_05560 [Thermoplasmata archaeon]|nr:hypothetical protein [Thermoplasmata archaeon]